MFSCSLSRKHSFFARHLYDGLECFNGPPAHGSRQNRAPERRITWPNSLSPDMHRKEISQDRFNVYSWQHEIKWRSFLKLNIEAQLSLFTFLILICCLIVSLQLYSLLEDVFTASLCGQKASFSFDGHSDVYSNYFFCNITSLQSAITFQYYFSWKSPNANYTFSHIFHHKNIQWNF